VNHLTDVFQVMSIVAATYLLHYMIFSDMITREAEKVSSRYDGLTSSSSSSSSSMNAEPTPEPPARRSKSFACYDTAAGIQQSADSVDISRSTDDNAPELV